jgi:excisionase family DNA binding protein
MRKTEFLSPLQVAEYLKVTRRTVYSWIKEGYLPAVKAGPKLWQVAAHDLETLLRPGEVSPVLPPSVEPVEPVEPDPTQTTIFDVLGSDVLPDRVQFGGTFGNVSPRIPPAKLSSPTKKGRKR